MNNLQTDLLGTRIEMMERGKTDPANKWFDDRDSSRGDLVGVIRSVGVGTDGAFLMHIEDDAGWIHTRSSRSHVFRIAEHTKVNTTTGAVEKIMTVRDLSIGQVFRFKPALNGLAQGKIVLVERAPGWAMPEGWDFLVKPAPTSNFNTYPVELLDEAAPIPSRPVVPEEK